MDSPRLELRSEQEMFLFSSRSRLAMGPTQSPVYKVLEFLSWAVKRPARAVTNTFTPCFRHGVNWKNGVSLRLFIRISFQRARTDS